MTGAAPFPSRGKGRGWGGGTASPISLEDSVASAIDGVSASHVTGPASTPTQPSPLEGEGFVGFDRFTRTPKIKAGGVERARRLRKEPTRAEARLWESLRRLEVRFRRQAPIGPYVVDFACHSAKLVIEVDGGVHQRPDVALRDFERDEWLAAQGYRVIRIPNRQIQDDIDGVVDQISKAAGVFAPPSAARASTPSQPFPLEGKGSSEY